jgi:hypothetical protein
LRRHAPLMLLTCFAAITSQAAAQEHLLGKKGSEALTWAQKLYSSAFVDKDHRIMLSEHVGGYMRWNYWPVVVIDIDSVRDFVKEVTLLFSDAHVEQNVLSKRDREQAIKDLTKEFGKSLHRKMNDREFWHWTDSIGSYDFIRYKKGGSYDLFRYSTNTCILECKLFTKKD